MAEQFYDLLRSESNKAVASASFTFSVLSSFCMG